MNATQHYLALVQKARDLTQEIQGFSLNEREETRKALKPRLSKSARVDFSNLLAEIEALLKAMGEAATDPVQITLSRSFSIAQFFAFRFVHQPRLELKELLSNKFYGSGIYAIYYIGSNFSAYAPLAGSETPIYVGKANPEDPYAETTDEQGFALHKRLAEHAKTIESGGFNLKDFQYRCATVQSGLQEAVEGFLIQLFAPIWNKEIKIAHGFGKHGDNATTRANRRSPWDTLHPGRQWAIATRTDQVTLNKILERIANHLKAHPPIAHPDELRKKLTEGSVFKSEDDLVTPANEL